MDNSGTAPLQITINGQEFDVNEAQELIEVGKKTRELEQRYSTKLDNVWPEYGRSQQRIKELEAAEAKVREFEAQKAKEPPRESRDIPQDVRSAQEAARKLNIALKDDLAGYMTKAEVDEYLEKREKERDEKQRATDAVLKRADELEKEINGSDGRPKFSKRQVLAYASAYGMNDLSAAYEDMWKEEIDSWKQAQIERERSKGLKTLKGGGTPAEPKAPRVTDSNFRDILKESLASSE